MGLRYEAWSTPWDPAGFRRKVSMLPVIAGSGQGSVGFLSLPGDSSADLSLATFRRLDELISATESSLITVFDCQPDGTQTIIDEWILNRVPTRLEPDRTVSLSGPGLLNAFESALVYAFDYPKAPAVQSDWIWGAGDDSDSSGLIGNGDFENSPFPNGGFEDGNTGYWQPTEDDGGFFATSTILAVFDSGAARSGNWYGQVVVNSQGDGIRRSISGLIPGESYNIVGWINEPTGAGDRLRAGIIGASLAVHTNAYEEDEIWWAEIGNATQGNGASTGAYQQVSLTFVAETDSIELVVIYDDINDLDFHVDDFAFTTGENVGLDPWVGFVNRAGVNPSPQQALNVFRYSTTHSHSGASSVELQGIDDAYYDLFGRIGYGTFGMSQDITMVPGRLYTFTAWIRHNGTGTNGANERFRLVLARRTPKGTLTETITGEFAPGPGSYYMANTDLVIAENTWTKIQLTTFADVADISAQIRYAGTNVNNSDVGPFTSPTFWVDDVSIHEGLPATSIGDIWQKLLDDCSLHHASDPRGTVLDWVDYSSFDATLDSNGSPWNEDITFLARWGSNMAHVLDDTFNLGYEAELVRKATPSGGKTHDFHLYNPGGRDDDPESAVHTAQPIIGGEAVKRNPSATAVLVVGPDGSYTEDTDATSLANFGRLEALVQDSEATGPTTRQLLANNFFAFEAANRNAVRYEVIEAPGVPRPFVAYRPGDTIPMTFAPTMSRQNRRVQRIDYVNTEPSQYVVVGSRLLEGEAAAFDLIGRMWRRMNRPAKIEIPTPTSGATGGGGGGPMTVFVAASDGPSREKETAHYQCAGADDQDVIQQAIDEVQASPHGGTVQLGSGHFVCGVLSSDALLFGLQFGGGALNQTGVVLKGMGMEATHIAVTGNASGLSTLIDWSGNGPHTITDFTVDDQTTDTNTHYVVQTGQQTVVERVYLYTTDPGSYCLFADFASLVRDSYFNADQDGHGIFIAAEGVQVIGCYFSGCDIGVHVDFSNGISTLIGNNFDGCVTGMHLDGGEQYVIVGNVFQSIAEAAVLFGNSDLNQLTFVGNSIAMATIDPTTEAAVLMVPAATIHGGMFAQNTFWEGAVELTANNMVIVGNQWLDSPGDGLVIVGIDNLIAHNLIASPGLGTDNTYDGIRLEGNSDRNLVQGNKVIPATSGNQPRYGINISAATCDDNILSGNDLRVDTNYGTADINDAGTGTIIDGNYGGSGASGASSSNMANFTQAGTLSTGTGSFKLPFTLDAEILSVQLAVATSPTGADLIVDVHKNGTTVFTTQANRPTVPAADADGVGAEAVPDVTSISEGEYLTVDIDQVGSTTPGSDLTVSIEWRPA